MPSRIHAFPSEVVEPIWLFPDDSRLKAHASYTAAKAGDVAAAVELVSDLGFPFLGEIRDQLAVDACFVAPHAREATGDNAIPQVLAQACAMLSGGEADTDIVQISRVFHTGADPMERIATRAEFEGLVMPGRPHVLVDDVTTMGGTLAELANYIHTHGGNVAAVLVLVNAGRIKQLHPKNQLFAKSNPATAMKSKKSSTSIPLPSPQMKPAISSASARLTRSEIDSLRQGKKQIADYAQKALKDKVSEALAEKA